MKNVFRKIPGLFRSVCDSLKFRVLFIVFATCIPVLLLFFIMNQYSVNVIQQKIYENNLDILSLNVKQMDSELSKVRSYILNDTDSILYETKF